MMSKADQPTTPGMVGFRILKIFVINLDRLLKIKIDEDTISCHQQKLPLSPLAATP